MRPKLSTIPGECKAKASPRFERRAFLISVLPITYENPDAAALMTPGSIELESEVWEKNDRLNI